MSSKTDFKLFVMFGFLILLFFNSQSLQAQNFVSKTVAILRLDTKLAEVDLEVQQGQMSHLDQKIIETYVEYTLICLDGNQSIEQALQIGYDKTNQSYSNHPDQVALLKQELQELLEQ